MPAIEAAFPGAVREGKVDRTLLAQEIAGSPERLKQLEAIVHPMVVAAEIDFLREQEEQGAKLAVLEIPLLFETGAHTRVDVTVVVSAPEEVQRERVLARPGMTPDKLEASARAPASRRREAGAGRLRCGQRRRRLQTCRIRSIRFFDSLQGREGRVMERLRHGQATYEELSLREIVLDTETTGLDPFDGHRVVEIGCVELLNCIPTGRVWHCHLNPERDMPLPGLRGARALRRVPARQAALPRARRRHARPSSKAPCWSCTTPPSISASSMPSSSGWRGRCFAGTAWSIRWRWRGGGIPARRAASMRCASATASICPSARSMARCSIAACLPSVYVELVGGHQARLEFAVNGGRGGPARPPSRQGEVRPIAACPAAHRRGAAAHAAFVASLGAEALWRLLARSRRERSGSLRSACRLALAAWAKFWA